MTWKNYDKLHNSENWEDPLPAPVSCRNAIFRWKDESVADPGGGRGDAPPPHPCRQKKRTRLSNWLRSDQLQPSYSTSTWSWLVTLVTTASMERASVGLVKSDHCSTMSEWRLNALLRLYVHKDIQLDFEEVVTTYGNKHPRRMLLGRPLDAWFSSCLTSFCLIFLIFPVTSNIL